MSSQYFGYLEIVLFLHWTGDGVCKSTGEERRIVFVPGLVSDKQNIGTGEKVGFELQATSKSGDKKPLDAKQLLATVPKTKEELFDHDVNWSIYDKVKNYPPFPFPFQYLESMFYLCRPKMKT
jgi:hypothetical protein